MLWAGIYVYNKGFTSKWRGFVTKEISKRGIDVKIWRLTLDPFNGLVARRVRILDKNDQEKTLAEIDSVALDINYANLMRGVPFLNAIELRNTDLTLPIDPSSPESAKIDITRLNARLLLPPHQAYLSHAEANIYGIHVNAAGRLINPEAFRREPEGPDTGGHDPQTAIKRVLDVLRKLHYEGSAPTLSVRFSGDLAEPDKLFVEANLTGGPVKLAGYTLKSLKAQLTYRDGLAKLHRLAATDALGSLEASGSYDPSSGKGGFQASSGIDLQRLSHALELSKFLDEVVFYGSPSVELTARTDFQNSPPFNVIGHVALKKFAWRSVMFDSLESDFSADNTSWFVHDLRLRHRSGELSGSALRLPGDFRLRVESTINPTAVNRLFTGKLGEAMSEWNFADSPALTLSASGKSPGFENTTAEGRIKLGRTVFRGAGMNAATAKVLIKDRSVSYDQFVIERNEGTATGSFTYDFGKHEVRLADVKTKLNPVQVAPWIEPGMARNVEPYRFKGPPNLTVNGKVQFEGGKDTNLEILVDAPNGMDYTFLKKNLSSPRISGKLLFTDGRLRLSNVVASLYRGTLRGDADISLDRNSPGYTASVALDNVDFASVTKLYFNYEDSQGSMSGAYSFSGLGDDPRTMKGTGQVSVLEGNVFAIPWIGPLSGILNTIVPGLGYNQAHEATATFTVNGGVIENKDLVIKGVGFSMIGSGKLHYLDDKMDFNIRINAQGLPGVLLFPVSKLFEYASDSSLSKPVWRPKIMPKL
jgi:hypothetical protein